MSSNKINLISKKAMLTEIFLSLISGIALIFGLNPHSPYYLADKLSLGFSSIIQFITCLGIINGIILYYIAHKRELVSKKFAIITFTGAVLGQIGMKYFSIENFLSLRHFAWFLFGSAFISLLFKDFKILPQKIQSVIVFILAFFGQIPGVIGWLLLILFLNRQKISLKLSLLITLSGILGSTLTHLSVIGKTVLTTEIPQWHIISLAYLFACFGLFFSTWAIQKIFNSAKEKLLNLSSLSLALLFLFLTSRYGDMTTKEQKFIHSFSSMGTTCEITVWNFSSWNLNKHCLEAQEIFDKIEAVMSNYKPESELSQLNKTAFAKPFACSEILWENFLWAEKAYQVSEKSFDVTIGPLVNLWSIKKHKNSIPTSEAIQMTLKKIGFDKLKLDHEKRTVQFLEDGMYVDFGGITKGWAVDQAVKYLYSVGETKFIINLGGNLYCSQQTPLDKKNYHIGIKNPQDPNKLSATVEGTGLAIATSGNYEQFIIIDGIRYTHIIDPRTGYPVANVDSVTIVSPSATVCDIFSTSVFINGEKSVEKLGKEFPEMSILFIDIREDTKAKVLKSGIFNNLEIKLD